MCVPSSMDGNGYPKQDAGLRKNQTRSSVNGKNQTRGSGRVLPVPENPTQDIHIVAIWANPLNHPSPSRTARLTPHSLSARAQLPPDPMIPSPSHLSVSLSLPDPISQSLSLRSQLLSVSLSLNRSQRPRSLLLLPESPHSAATHARQATAGDRQLTFRRRLQPFPKSSSARGRYQLHCQIAMDSTAFAAANFLPFADLDSSPRLSPLRAAPTANLSFSPLPTSSLLTLQSTGGIFAGRVYPWVPETRVGAGSGKFSDPVPGPGSGADGRVRVWYGLTRPRTRRVPSIVPTISLDIYMIQGSPPPILI
ncbi:uncharacterized protein LOC104582646 [Brachypodium distachyon]|uniref:uncharacterized protein LOC104582646 n=1 Tax=Brachypodium distachyon TaxID=15368 RepID=UPI00071CE411|nr:uncharacterized protein LOC104582646 [Brachypodium distachyon]|eukprot:XP_014755354.1 uncharacterized protein LOC104582646 [Brachypodium distachyon]